MAQHPTNKIDEAEYDDAPQGTLAEVRAAGYDPLKVRSCAVEEPGRIKGCRFGAQCASETFGLPEYGGFGPKQNVPGASGEGWENVSYDYTDRASGTRKQECVRCYAFMATMADRWRQQRLTGDKIVILGGPGTPYVELVTTTKSVKGMDDKMAPKVVTDSVERVVPSRHEESGATVLNTGHLDKIEANNRKIAAQRTLEASGRREPAAPVADVDTGEESAAAVPVTGGGRGAGNRRG